MKGTRLLAGVLVAMAAVVVVVLARTGGSDAPADRPDHLLDARSITAIAVRDPATGRTGTADVPALAPDPPPLLAIRTFARRRPDYGLAPPRLDVTITTATR